MGWRASLIICTGWLIGVVINVHAKCLSSLETSTHKLFQVQQQNTSDCIANNNHLPPIVLYKLAIVFMQQYL
jgi:hypothetical protein